MTTLEALAAVSAILVGIGAFAAGAVRSLWRLARFIDRLEQRVDALERSIRVIEGHTTTTRTGRR